MDLPDLKSREQQLNRSFERLFRMETRELRLPVQRRSLSNSYNHLLQSEIETISEYETIAQGEALPQALLYCFNRGFRRVSIFDGDRVVVSHYGDGFVDRVNLNNHISLKILFEHLEDNRIILTDSAISNIPYILDALKPRNSLVHVRSIRRMFGYYVREFNL